MDDAGRSSRGPPWPGEARVTFDWLEGAPLLVQRWHVDLPEAPDGTAVIGCDGMSGTYYQLYTDERDVQRIYEMSLVDGVWKLGATASPSPSGSRARFRGREDDRRSLGERRGWGDLGDRLRPDLHEDQIARRAPPDRRAIHAVLKENLGTPTSRRVPDSGAQTTAARADLRRRRRVPRGVRADERRAFPL